MTNPEQPARCTHRAALDVRRAAQPTLEAHRAARPFDPEPLLDWRCARGEHDLAEQHLATPLGPSGPSIRFDTSDGPQTLDELLARPGVAVVRVEHGDELLMLMPHDDTDTAERAATTLAELFPSVAFLVLSGVTGAVVMPRRDVDQADAEPEQGDAAAEQGDAAAEQPSRAQQLVDELRASDEYDDLLVDALADLGRRWGPYGVARAAAHLTGTTLARDDAAQPGPPEPRPESPPSLSIAARRLVDACGRLRDQWAEASDEVRQRDLWQPLHRAAYDVRDALDGDQAAPDYHAEGVYCGEPSHCTPPYPEALPGTPYDDQAAPYVHALLDAWLTGTPLDFQREHVPADVRRRLDDALAAGTLTGVQTEIAAGLWRNAVTPPAGDVDQVPPYVHALLDAWLGRNGGRLDFRGAHVPDAVRRRLVADGHAVVFADDSSTG